ncbi:MAG: VOC family protein, partial [Micromonosporaceae bacterium]
MTHGSDSEVKVSRQENAEEPAWPPTLTPYIAVSDGRRALDWYAAVLGAQLRGDIYVMPDGSIGHAEIALGNAVLMVSEGSSEVPVRAPEGDMHSHSLHLQVVDVDTVTARAAKHGAAVEREPTDEPYGRVSVVVDPFGHRWMFNTPPEGAGNPAET